METKGQQNKEGTAFKEENLSQLEKLRRVKRAQYVSQRLQNETNIAGAEYNLLLLDYCEEFDIEPTTLNFAAEIKRLEKGSFKK